MAEDTTPKEGEPSGQAAAPQQQEAAPAATDNAEVPRRNADYWDRQTQREKDRQARAEYFKTKQRRGDGEAPAAGDDLGENDDDRPLTRAELNAEFDKRERVFEEKNRDVADSVSITSFLARPENQKFAKYETRARAYAKTHPYYPITGIFRDLAYDDAMSDGASTARRVEDKVTRSSVRGTAQRPKTSSGFPDLTGMTPAQRKEALNSFRGKMRKGQASFQGDE